MGEHRGWKHRVKLLIRWPPDFSLGFQPTSQVSFRAFLGLMNLLKNVIPMIVLQRFQTTILTRQYNNAGEVLPDIVGILPYTLLLLTIFPINASIVKFERAYQNFLSIDLTSNSRLMYQRILPTEDKKFDLFNNRMDIINKIGYYSGFAIFPVSFTLPPPDSIILLGIGIFIFALQGYQSGYWFDIVNRVKVLTIYESQDQLGHIA